MTIHALALTNPGAEAGNTTGWTVRTGPTLTASTTFPHSGTYRFENAITNTGTQPYVFNQQVDVSAYATAIDANTAGIHGTGYHLTIGGDDGGFLKVECYASDGTTLLGSKSNSESHPTSWSFEEIFFAIPSGTRFVRIGAGNYRRDGIGTNSYWDDFTLDITDNREGDYPAAFAVHAYQAVAYAVATYPSAATRMVQAPVLVMGAGETSTGLEVRTNQVVAYALVKGKVDRVDLRAWTFLQDDHLFYGLQLGNLGTIVYDMLTQQWCQWSSPGFAYYRAEDVTDWEGFNLACDTENGTVWQIDPTSRLDNGDTVIVSQATGGATVRARRAIPCYTAELACSQAAPAAETGTSIRLRTSDDGTNSWVDHGTVDGESDGTATLFRWYGLGLMTAPGRIFELTNTGYARRIDGLDAELGQR